MPPPRARNTASAKDLVKCFRSHFKDLDPAAFRKDVEEVIAQYEGLLADIMDETVRPSESVLRDGLVRSYDVSGKGARAVARDISACFKHLRSKLQSSSSGKKLTPSVWRLVSKLKQLTGQGTPQKAMDPMKEREPVETPGAAQALPAGDPAPFKPSRRYRFKRKATASCDVFSMYGLPATAINASVDDEAAAEASDVGEADQVDSDSDVLVVKDSEEEDLQAAAAIPLAKAYFDPSQGCYVKALEGGKCIHGELKEGAAGFCMVYFPDEEPFESQVPNLWLSSRKSTPAFKFSKRGKAAFGKAKKKAKRAAEPAGKEAEATVGSSESGESNQELLAAAPLELESWNGYPLAGMPQEALPPSGCSGLHSYTVKALILGTSVSIDVLMRGKAFYIKRPEICKGQHSWSKHSSITECWVQCLEKIKDTLRDEKDAVPNLE
ncbi:unnamed protein product [Effrenium voratum]|uniref:Uncharacterized protein n=1 Tax=Effrenium voratum TaxID=2562239 RepID=A0AA36J013_9DINO|nr:unnamed protein product [Effrenium voratum]